MQITVVIHILIYAWLDYADASQTWLLNNRLGLILSPIFISCFKQILLTLLWTCKGFTSVEIHGFFACSSPVENGYWLRELWQNILCIFYPYFKLHPLL